MDARIAFYPRVLLLSPEYEYDGVDRGTFDQSGLVYPTANNDDNDIEPSKGFKRKKSHKSDSRPTKRRKTESESALVYAEETSGFRLMRRINVENRRYVHICSVFAQPAHFWTVVTYKGRTWIGGKKTLGGMRLYGQDEFVTQPGFMGTCSNPVIHAYALEKEKMEEANEDLDAAINRITLEELL